MTKTFLGTSAICSDCHVASFVRFWQLLPDPFRFTVVLTCPHCWMRNRIPWYWGFLAVMVSIPITLLLPVVVGGWLHSRGLWQAVSIPAQVVKSLASVGLIGFVFASCATLLIRIYFSMAQRPFDSWWDRFQFWDR